jgi:hypothetical protein
LFSSLGLTSRILNWIRIKFCHTHSWRHKPIQTH